MTHQELLEWIESNLANLAKQRYSTPPEQIAYELGLAMSILANLAYSDSHNAHIISAKFKQLNKTKPVKRP